MRPNAFGQHLNRRVFLKSAVASVAVLPLSCASNDLLNSARRNPRFGIVTDCHYADADPAGSRYYRRSLDKLTECVARMNAEKVDFLIELGDFKDQDRPPVEGQTLTYLETVEEVFQQFTGPTYHVIGNHDVDSISKPQFLARVTNTGIDPARSYYAFDSQGLHCIVLDANHKADGADYDRGNFDWTDANVPPEELAWLRDDLATSTGPVIVFTHQLLDGSGDVYISNATAVRNVLEESGRVLAVFQGHHHAGDHNLINGIHYYTLIATVEGQEAESSSYATVELRPDLGIVVTGYRRAQSGTFPTGQVTA
jgi:calcineurin-like phosphoesterase family protein